MTMIVWSLRYRQTVSAGEIMKAKEFFKCSEAMEFLAVIIKMGTSMSRKLV